MTSLRSADDFASIRARMKELRGERAESPVEKEARLRIDPPVYESGSRPPTRPGIPGWRVTRRKRPSSD